MKTHFSLLLIASMITGLLFYNCEKKDSTSPDNQTITPQIGIWTGEDISFTVLEDPLAVANIQAKIEGHAEGTKCSFNYETSSMLPAYAEVDKNTFSFESSLYTIDGKFTSNEKAELTISWSLYNSNCDANYSGSKTYFAAYDPEANVPIDTTSAESDSTVDVTGAWDVVMTTTISINNTPVTFDYTTQMTLIQTDSIVTGTFGTEGVIEGEISGIVQENIFTFTIEQTVPCEGLFEGTGTIESSGKKCNGEFSGSDCDGARDVSFKATLRE